MLRQWPERAQTGCLPLAPHTCSRPPLMLDEVCCVGVVLVVYCCSYGCLLSWLWLFTVVPRRCQLLQPLLLLHMAFIAFTVVLRRND